MFWTAFIWGLGVSLGGGIGLVGFVLTMWALQWVTGRAAHVEAMQDFSHRSLAALLARNLMTEDTNAALQRIVVTLEAMNRPTA